MCNTYKCQNCGASFDEKPNCANKYCSKDCYYVARWGEKRPWADCSGCLAEIGFGKRITGQILGVKPATILSQRKRDGIKTNTPPMGSWYIWSKRKAAGKNPDKKREAHEVAYDKARMEDIQQACKSGFDWRYEWVKERAKRHSSAKYHAMTAEDKKLYNKRCMTNRHKQWAKNPEAKARDLARMQEWKRRNPEKNSESIRKSIKKRKKSDPGYRVLCNMRGRFSALMKSVKNGGTLRFSELIGCTTKQLAQYLQKQFDNHITWDNYGKYWDVDHIIPCSKWDHNDPKQVAQCWHYTNLQPLDQFTNRHIKRDNIVDGQMNLLIDYEN